MYVLKIALQKLAARPGSTLFSVLLFAIGISIISLIILADYHLNKSIEQNFSGIDMVVGAKGSPTQLILSAVLHADYPTGNISLYEAENLARHPAIKNAIPLALGDSYHGFRIVGAPLEYPQLYNASLQSGQWYQNELEVTIGVNVALASGLKTGDQFAGVHGFQDMGHVHDEFSYTVTGIHSGSGVLNNLILTPVASVWKVHANSHDDEEHLHEEHANDLPADHQHHDDEGHVHEDEHGHDHEHDTQDHQDHSDSDHAPEDTLPLNPAIAAIQEKIDAGEDISSEEMILFQAHRQSLERPSQAHDKEITAMLLQFRNPGGNIQLSRLINETTNMQAASPALEINRLLKLLSVGFDVFMSLAWIIIAISGINIFIHMWNTLRQGMQDIALMRVMGAGRVKVFAMLVYQGAIIALAGWLAGMVFSRIIWLLLPEFHFLGDGAILKLYPQEMILLFYALFTGIIASLFPAWWAYNTDVHFTLTQKK